MEMENRSIASSELMIDEDLIQTPAQKSATITTIDLGGLLHPPLKLHEDVKEGCGGQVWPAGTILARYMIRKHSDLEGKEILAVARGCRITTKLYITDQETMLPLMRQNIQLNHLEDKVVAGVLNWGGTSLPTNLPHTSDIILAADCVYFEPSFPLLLETLSALVGKDSIVYFCFKKRRRADMQFMRMARKKFLVEEVQDDPDRDTYTRDSIFLYTFRKK
ncbi:MAG: hypothetical protein M1816_002911 [Peltula sp. TS41687]|nr:MAG: hypothetical protein M1816_002911 [Peltula sp. TS41687]